MELEQRLLEATLRQQQIQSEEDSRWLHQEENNLVSLHFSLTILFFFCILGALFIYTYCRRNDSLLHILLVPNILTHQMA